MSLIRFVGTNREFGEWLVIWLKIELFIAHLNKRRIIVPTGCKLSWTVHRKTGIQLFTRYPKCWEEDRGSRNNTNSVA